MAPSSLIDKKAPTFTLKNHDGADYEFKPESGAPTAIFFYPKSGSYGCTREACQFRDALVKNDAFKGSNLRVIGISPDSVEEQAAFVQSQNLTYPVLSDSAGEFRKSYGVGKGLLGLTEARVTYFIDSEGIVRDVVDATMNYSAHVTFVNKCLAKYDNKGKFSEQSPAGETQLTSDYPCRGPTLLINDGIHRRCPLISICNLTRCEMLMSWLALVNIYVYFVGINMGVECNTA